MKPLTNETNNAVTDNNSGFTILPLSIDFYDFDLMTSNNVVDWEISKRIQDPQADH